MTKLVLLPGGCTRYVFYRMDFEKKEKEPLWGMQGTQFPGDMSKVQKESPSPESICTVSPKTLIKIKRRKTTMNSLC